MIREETLLDLLKFKEQPLATSAFEATMSSMQLPTAVFHNGDRTHTV